MFLLATACAPHTTFLEYPVVVEGVKSTYIKDSDGNCYLKAPQENDTELRIYDESCDSIADSVAMASVQERFYFLHDRKDLTIKSQQYLDALLQKAVKETVKESIRDKQNIRHNHEIFF